MPFGYGFTGEFVILTSHIHNLLLAAVATMTIRPHRGPRPGALLTASVRYVKPKSVEMFALPNGQGVAVVVFGRRQRNHKVDDSPAHFWIADAQEGAIQLQALGRGEEVDDIGLRRLLGEAAAIRLRRRAFEKVRRRDLERSGRLLQAAGADSIRALFVFLDLLERHTEKFAELALAHADHCPAHSQPRADIDIDHVGR